MDRRRFLRIGYRLHSNIIGINGVDNCAQRLFRTIRCVAVDIQEMANEKMSEKPNVRWIQSYSAIINDRMQLIQDNLIKLGANKKCINETLKLVEQNDVYNANCNVLQLLAQRHPRAYKRKLAAYQRYIEQKQRG